MMGASCSIHGCRGICPFKPRWSLSPECEQEKCKGIWVDNTCSVVENINRWLELEHTKIWPLEHAWMERELRKLYIHLGIEKVNVTDEQLLELGFPHDEIVDVRAEIAEACV